MLWRELVASLQLPCKQRKRARESTDKVSDDVLRDDNDGSNDDVSERVRLIRFKLYCWPGNSFLSPLRELKPRRFPEHA